MQQIINATTAVDDNFELLFKMCAWCRCEHAGTFHIDGSHLTVKLNNFGPNVKF